MKKLKNSVKAIIISAVAVVIAVSAVLAVVLTRKDGDGNNPPPKNPPTNANYQLTPAQLGLVNAINAQTDAKYSEMNKELKTYDSSRFVTSDGTLLSAGDISYMGDSYVIRDHVINEDLSDQDYMYFKTVGTQEVLVSLNDQLFGTENNFRCSAIDINDSYVAYAIMPTEGTYIGTRLVIVYIGDIENPVIVSDQTWEEGELVEVDVNLNENYYVTSFYYKHTDSQFYYDTKVFNNTTVPVTADDVLFELNDTEEYFDSHQFQFRENGFIIKTSDHILLYSKTGEVEFVEQAGHYYDYKVLDAGVLITTYDSMYQNPQYSFLSKATGQIVAINLDAGYKFVSISDINQDYFYILEKENEDEDAGRFLYFDSSANLVISYNSQTDDDKINYSNGKLVLLYNKLISTENKVEASDVIVLNQENSYNILDVKVGFNDEFFATLGEMTNIANYDGDILFEDNFDQIYEYQGKYIGVVDGVYYILNLSNSTKDEIENVDEEKTLELLFDNKKLIDYGYVVSKNNNIYSICDFSGNVVNVVYNNETYLLSNIIGLEIKDMYGYVVLEIEFSNNDIVYLTLYSKTAQTYSSSRLASAPVTAYASSTKGGSKITTYVDFTLEDNNGAGQGDQFPFNLTLSYGTSVSGSRNNGATYTERNPSCGAWVDSYYSYNVYAHCSVEIKSFMAGWAWADHVSTNWVSEYNMWYYTSKYAIINNKNYATGGSDYSQWAEDTHSGYTTDKHSYAGNPDENRNVRGASFIGWSDTYFDSQSGYFLRGSQKSAPTYEGKVYTYNFSKNSGLKHDWYIYGVYEPDVYTVMLNVQGNLPDSLAPNVVQTNNSNSSFSSYDSGYLSYLYHVPYWISGNTSHTYGDGKTYSERVYLPTLSVVGYTFGGWKRTDSLLGKDEVSHANETYGTSSYYAHLSFGAKYGVESETVVTFAAIWTANAFDISFNYGSKANNSTFNGYVKVNLSLVPHPEDNDKFYVGATLGVGNSRTDYKSLTTQTQNRLYFTAFKVGSTTYGLGVKTTSGGSIFPVYSASTNAIIEYTAGDDNLDCPAKMVAGTDYYFIQSYNINQNSSIFKVLVDGKNVSTSQTWSSPSNLTANNFVVKYNTTYNPDAPISAVFGGSNAMTSAISDTVININNTTVTGSSTMFAGWLVQFTSDKQTYTLQWSTINLVTKTGSSTILDYLKMLNNGNFPSTIAITLYALYSMKPYNVDYSGREIENSSTSFSGDYASKVKEVDSELNPNLEDAKLINSGLVSSVVQISPSVASPVYLGQVSYELKISNSEAGGQAQDSTEKPYYIFDKIEVYNLGVKFYSGGSYSFYNAKLIFTWGGTSWTVKAYYDNNDDGTYETEITGNKKGGSIDSSSNPFYIGTYKTGDDAANKYNKVYLTNTTATTVTLNFVYLGISGDYYNTGNSMTHENKPQYDFRINADTAEGGYFGFSVMPYVKSNHTLDDGIVISTASNTSADKIYTYAIQKMYKDGDNKYYIWLDNIKYGVASSTLSTEGAGYYAVNSNGTISKSDKTAFLSGSTLYDNLIYIYKEGSDYFAQIPQKYVTESGGTKLYKTHGTTGSNGTKVNYGSSLLYAIRPEQKELYASQSPSAATKQSMYELTGYISTLDFGSDRVFTFDVRKNIVNKDNQYIYADLSIYETTTNDFKGSTFGKSNFDEINSTKKVIKYLGGSYQIHHAWYMTYGGNSGDTAYKNRAFILYLTRKSDTGEFMYFMYTDIYSANKKESDTTTATITFTFTKFASELDLHVNDTNSSPTGDFTVDTNDLFDATDVPLVYRYYYAHSSTINDYSSAGLTKKSGSTEAIAFAGKTTSDAQKYFKTTNIKWGINPDDYVVFELQPTDGYLINHLVIIVKGKNGDKTIVNLKLDTSSLVNLERANSTQSQFGEYFAYTTSGDAGIQTNITYAAATGTQYFSNYVNSGNSKMLSGIGYSRSIGSEWATTYSGAKFNPIWIMLSGVYDDIEIHVSTTSYLEFNIKDENGNLGDNGESGDGIQLADLTYLSLIAEIDNVDIKLGTYHEATGVTYESSYILYNSYVYRIIFVGKGIWFRNGLHLHASGETYSAYFTDAKLYLDVSVTGSGSSKTVNANPTAFERFNHTPESVYYGRDASGGSLYNNGDGRNQVIYNSNGTPASSPHLDRTNKTVGSSDYINYFYIPNVKDYFLDASAFSRVYAASSNFEYSNKYILGMTIVKNVVSSTMNSYIYNATLTSTETKPTTNEYSYEILGHSDNIEHYYNTTKYQNWLKVNDVWSCYQLDYVGTLGTGDDAINYTKKSSWFNDTILTNIDMRYNNASGNASTQNNQVGKTQHSNLTRNVYGYNLSYTYYEIAGYYLQYIEIVTVDYGSIYIPVATALSHIADNSGPYKASNESANPFDDDNNIYSSEYRVYTTSSFTLQSGLYVEMKYIATEGIDPKFEINLYQDNSDILAAAKTLNLLSNDFTVNFYSYPYSYTMEMNSFASDGGTNSKSVISSEDTLKVYDNGVLNDSEAQAEKKTQTVVYDSLSTINRYLTMDGYTFIGWGSAKAGSTLDYRYDETENIWSSSSAWHDVRALFGSSNRSRFVQYWKDVKGLSYASGVLSSYGDYDFYVKSTTSANHNKTGYFITDTGFGNAPSEGYNTYQENYNFWSVYDYLFLQNLGQYGKDDFSTIKVYAVWKANTYTIRFDVNDSKVQNGSTAASLQVSKGVNRSINFRDRFDETDYLYYNIYKGPNSSDYEPETYYTFVTFDSTDWYVKAAKSLAGNLKKNDKFNSYRDGNTSSFINRYEGDTYDLKTVIDRYGYTWLGWFSFASSDTDKNKNTKQEAANYETRRTDMVFGSNYYKNMASGGTDATTNYYTYYGGSTVSGGTPTLNKDLYDRFKANGTLNEVVSEFVYWGEHKIVSSLGNSYVSYYKYKTDTSSTTVKTLSLAKYSNSDWLNTFTETDDLTDNANGSPVGSSITYFDTTLTYSSYTYNKDDNSLNFVRSSDKNKNRLLVLTAYWEENNYKFVVDWQDNNGNDDGDDIFTVNQYGSSEAGILQADGSVLKEDFGTAYFDDFELSERLNKFTPVRVGYDFIGWTYYFSKANTSLNVPSTYIMSFDQIGDNAAYSVNYHNYLRSNILTSNIVLYTKDNLLGDYTKLISTDFTEKFGDTELTNVADGNPHTVYIFALWKPQTFTINVDLNIEMEDLENLYDIDSNFAVALYDSSNGNGTYNIKGIRSDYYRLNAGYYTEIVANVNFTITFDQKFSTASCIVDGKAFYIKDLFATSAGYYFLGWLYNAGDEASLLLANSLQSMVSSYSNIVDSHNTEGSIGYNFGDPVFDINYHKDYLRVTSYKLRDQEADGSFDGGTLFKSATYNGGVVTSSVNMQALSDVDKHGNSSNFGYITIDGKAHPIVSEVEEDQNHQKTYYLYFRYLGVKYYVVMYYQPTANGERTAFTCDDSYLYFRSEGRDYKVRFDTDGVPYIITSDYDHRRIFKAGTMDVIKIAVFGQKELTSNITKNDMFSQTVADGTSYTFVNYISNVSKSGNTYTTDTNSKTAVFNVGTTRQFTMYAHWQHKNDFEIVINNGNNATENQTPSSNEGLAGFYEIENSFSSNHNNGKDVDDFMVSESNSKTNDDNGVDDGYTDPYLALTYNYYDNLDFNIVPFYNGRYISELVFKFYSVTESVKNTSDDPAQMKSDYIYTTYTLVFKFKWNADSHTISIDYITFNNGISAENVNLNKVATHNDEYSYTKINGLAAGGSEIDQLSIIDSTSFAAYILKMFDYSNGSTTTNVGIANNDVNATYNRLEVNKVAFNLTKVMSSIDITCKFSVQTYSLEMYHFLDDNEKRQINHLQNVGDNNQYETDITPDDFQAILERSNYDGQEPFIAGEISNNTNVVTVSIDCASNVATYLVPYGYYIYGVYYDSSYVGYRPVDSTEPGFNANAIVTNPYYGFEWLYANSYYNYGSTTVPVEQFDGDMFNSQCSPILGSKNKFGQAVRLDNLANYNFVGWYETDTYLGNIKFIHYDKLNESRYINRNITLYGYYKPVNAPTSIEFYTWNDENKSYSVYNGNKQEYTLNANITKIPFDYDDATHYLTLHQDTDDFMDDENLAKIYVYNNYGINETAFNSKNNTTNIFDGDDFGQNDLQDQAMLDKILQTYWFYYYAYDVVDFVKTSGGDTQTHTLRYDKQRDDLGMAPFYYYTTESNPNSTKVYVNIKSADYENFEIYSEAGELIANNSSINLRTVVVYDFDGSYLYLKLPKTSNTGYDDANLERYYRVYEIPSVVDYVSEMSTKPGYNASDYAWVNKHEPRYYVDVLGVRYYLLPRTGVAPGTTGDIAKNNKAQVLYDKNGNTTVAASGSLITTEIAQYATFENINNYFVEYYEEYYQVNYTVYTDKGGSKFINPKADPLTNTVTLPEMAGNPTNFYLNYGNATLYYNGAPTTINHYMYCPVNTNYKSNVEFRSSMGRSSWETAGVTIKTLPSPHIGYWYDGGEEYAFVGYIMVNDAILETITKRGDSASGGEASSGDMYRAFLEYINAVYKFEDYDALEDFASQAALDSYLATYTPGQSGYGTARMQAAYTNFIADLKEKIGVQVGAYKLVNLCSNLLLADSYDYEDYGNKMISYVNVNVPVTFKDMAIANPKTGASTTSLSVSFLYKFSIITQNTEVRDNLYAIPIYSPFIMEYSEDDVTTSGSSMTVNVKEMDIWHFDIQNNATAHVYNVDSGDMVNFAVLTYEQYLYYRANTVTANGYVNLEDCLTKMLKQSNVLVTAEEVLSTGPGGVTQRFATIDFNAYSTGHYVVLAFYYKTGTVIVDGGDKDYSRAYVARVSDNILHVQKGADGNLTFEVTTMDDYE